MAAIVSGTPTPQDMTTSATDGKATTLKDSGRDGIYAKHNQYGTHFLLPPQLRSEVKNEPLIGDIGYKPNQPVHDSSSDRRATTSPKIRLTPTVKLMPTPNPVDPKRKFACPYENCTKSYGKSSHLRSHLTWHTGIKPFVCREPNCGKGFTRSDELNRHVRTHTGEKPFECVQCTKKFSRSDHLTKHLATHAKQMQTTTKKLRLPQNGQEPQQEEPETKKVFMEMQRPADHMRYNDGMHFMAALAETAMKQEPLPEPENLTGEPRMRHSPIKIKLEKPQHSNEYHVVSNVQPPRRHNISESEDEMPHELIVPVSTMICPPSPEIKSEPNDDAIMPEANAPPLPMDSAAYAIPDFGHFIAEVAYDPERPFRCNQCVKCFKRQDDLNRHLRTHTGEKPFACTECDRRFMRSDHLKKHLKTHTKLL